MGCSICLDAYGDEAGKGLQPVALPCGHVFHHACCNGWLRACRLKNDSVCCPLCKTELGAAQPVRLWPSEYRDLDTYLRHKEDDVERQKTGSHSKQSGRVTTAAASLDRHMSRDDQSKLLGNLLDFKQHLSAFVMAVNNVNMYDFGKRKQTMYGLLRDVDSEGVAGEELASSVEALSAAANIFNDAVIAVEREKKDFLTQSTEMLENSHKITQMRASWDKHMQIKEIEQKRMNDEAERSRRLRLHLQKELQSVERERVTMRTDKHLYEQEVQQKLAEASKMKTEALQSIAEKDGEADARVTQMKTFMQESEKLRLSAENKMRAAIQKSNHLADRTRLLDHKLSELRKQMKSDAEASSSSKAAGKGKSKDMEQAVPAYDDAMRALTMDTDKLAEQLEAATRSHTRQSSVAGSQATDPVIIDDDDWAGEMNDSDYPMPRFGARHVNDTNARNILTELLRVGRPPLLSRTNSTDARPQMTLSTSHVSIDDDDDADEGAVEYVGNKRKREDEESTQERYDESSLSSTSSTSSSASRPFLPGPVEGGRVSSHSNTSLVAGNAQPFSRLNASLPSNTSLTERLLRGRTQTGPRQRVR